MSVDLSKCDEQWCWNPEYRMVAKRKSSEMKVSVLAQMVLPKRSLYRYEKCRASYSGKRSCGDRSLGIANGNTEPNTAEHPVAIEILAVLNLLIW